MPRILVAMSSDSYHRVMSKTSRATLATLGEIVLCLDARQMDENAYAAEWARADACLSGWGVRAPSSEWFDDKPRLTAICHSAGSVRMFPRALIERGVIVTSARSAIARTVAEFALMCALALLRRLPQTTQAIRDKPASETLYGKTVSLIGCGYVGRCFRELLRPFDCPVLVADPFMSDAQAEELGVARAPLAEALLRADVVSLHAPDVPETRGMIGPRELAMLRDGCVLLNTARGRIIDTDALTAEAGTGRILAALDVTDPEPLPEDHPLRRMANVLLTPHVAGPTTDDLPRLGEMAVADLGLILRGERPRYPISLDDYDRMSF